MARRKFGIRFVREGIERREWKSVPEVSMQIPRFRIEAPGSHTPAFHLGNAHVVLKHGQRAQGRTETLARVSLKESSIPNAGYGVYLREAVVAGQLLVLYWGDKISMQEAERRRQKVPRLLPPSTLCSLQYIYTQSETIFTL